MRWLSIPCPGSVAPVSAEVARAMLGGSACGARSGLGSISWVRLGVVAAEGAPHTSRHLAFAALVALRGAWRGSAVQLC